LPRSVTARYHPYVSHIYYNGATRYPSSQVAGRYNGCTGVVDSSVFQKTVDFPEEYSASYSVPLVGEGGKRTLRPSGRD